ncbi:hypothetical protein ACH5RR_016088 [Cinchona calisaya]|uniref:Uncharacterized protein n=1 Tax=Cinchona calisaya TaxID=153742 RepID=A0ABD2ZV01_9GENT
MEDDKKKQGSSGEKGKQKVLRLKYGVGSMDPPLLVTNASQLDLHIEMTEMHAVLSCQKGLSLRSEIESWWSFSVLIVQQKRDIHVYVMGNNYSLVINNTTENITIKEWKETYCTGLNEPVRYSSKEGKNLGPGEHARFCPKDLKKRWKRRVKLMDTSTLMLVSHKGGEKSNKVVVLSIDEFERNIGIVINIGENLQLIKELVSRDEAKSFGKHEDEIEELKEHLVSIVVRLSPVCLSVSARPQEGEAEENLAVLFDNPPDENLATSQEEECPDSSCKQQ